jgi:hypothetical protein
VFEKNRLHGKCFLKNRQNSSLEMEYIKKIENSCKKSREKLKQLKAQEKMTLR